MLNSLKLTAAFCLMLLSFVSCKPVVVMTFRDAVGLTFLGILIVVGLLLFIGYKITSWWSKLKWRR